MQDLLKWLPLVVALLLNAGANVMMKIGSKTAVSLEADASFTSKLFNFLNPVTVVGIMLFAANVLFYRKALDKLDISIAYPIMVSGGLIIVTLAAYGLPVLHEKISVVQITGMLLIGAGVWLVASG